MLRANALLLLTAMIWGVAFVAQRVGMAYVGPFTFNGVRFTLGALSLVPLLLINRRRRVQERADVSHKDFKTVLVGGAMAGAVLFIAASLQQAGVALTTAGKAGFITGLYVVIVPLLGLLWGQQTALNTWLGALLAVMGLYLLSVTEDLTIAPGDLLVLIGAFFWAIHVHILSRFSALIGPVKLAFIQFVACAILSLLTAGLIENLSWGYLREDSSALMAALAPILYGGLLSVGVAYTLQVVAQRDAHPAHAAIILSSEAVFAVIGGWLILGEMLSTRGIVGCGLMLVGMLVSQLSNAVESS
jgi:drug/metabolite transporter (DMT)-like permease